MQRTILVASDGSPAAQGALRLAASLQDRHGFTVELLGVAEPVPVFDAGFLVALPEVELYESRQEILRNEIAGQVESLEGGSRPWTIRVESGLPGPRIVRRAEELGALLILLGLGRHRPLDRVFGTETALQVVRLSHIPVLAVPAGATALPRSAVLAVDFSGFSRRAAPAALWVLDPPWDVHLVHVISGMEFLPTVPEAWRGEYEAELRSRLASLGGLVSPVRGSKVHVELLEGEPAHEILSYAEGRGVEMIVAGSHGLSFMGRLLMGSVSTRLVRGARVPVMVVPPVEPAAELQEISDRGKVHPWVEELAQFTRANAGCKTTLELHDPELGLQECGKDFPLWGVDYDAKADRVDIMLGRSGTVEGHLTHSLPGPEEIEVVRGEGGRSHALRIRLRAGQVILRVQRD